jgi:hypothetical protein
VPSTTHLAVVLRTATVPGFCDRLPCPCSILSLPCGVAVQGSVLVGKLPLAVRQGRDECVRQPPLIIPC